MDRIPKDKLKVGMNVWIETTGNLARYGSEIFETEVVKIGNKYFYLDFDKEKKFNFKTGQEKSEYCKNYQVYFTKQEILDEREYYRINQRLRRIFDIWSQHKLTLQQLKNIEKIVDSKEATE